MKSTMRIVIYGCGENGFQAFHCLRHDTNIEILGFLDDNSAKHGKEYLGLPVLGDLNAIPKLIREAGVQGGIVGIGHNHTRGRMTARLREAGLELVRAIHPQVMVNSPERIGLGGIFEMGAAIHAGATIGDGVFMGTSAIVAHHCVIGDFTILSGGASFGGGVRVGSYTLIGVGASIHPHIAIGSNVIVGVGAAVVKDVPDNVVVAGVPARIIRTLDPDAT
ncbi:transferase [bacterium]|nr:MAG: transferase [bacterium]